MREKDPAAVALGRKGGLKGGTARREKLSPERRAEIATALGLNANSVRFALIKLGALGKVGKHGRGKWYATQPALPVEVPPQT